MTSDLHKIEEAVLALLWLDESNVATEFVPSVVTRMQSTKLEAVFPAAALFYARPATRL